MQTKTLANMKGRSRYNWGGALLLLLAALAFPFLAACSSDDDDSDSDTGNSAPSLDECVAIPTNYELDGNWTGKAKSIFDLYLTFSSNSNFSIEVKQNDTSYATVNGTYELDNTRKIITVTATSAAYMSGQASESNSSITFYVTAFDETNDKFTIYLKETTDEVFAMMQGEYIELAKSNN